MKRFLLFVCFILLGDALLAQAPHLFSFQSVIRDKDELLVTNKEVVMRFSINQYDSLGTTVFSEYHYVFTNSNGLMTAQIGSGENIIGSLEEINWGDGDFYAMYEVDFDDQTGWDMKAYTQLMSVPYALYAKYAESGTDADSTNEIQQIFIENDSIYITSGDTGISLSKYLDNTDDQIISISEDTIYLEDGGSIVLPELPPEVDMDSTNEIQILSLSGDTLYLTMGGTVDLSTYLDNTDDQILSLINDTLSLEDGGNVSLVTYLDNTDDQLLSISNDTISLEDGGSVVLPPLPPEVDMDSTNELQIISLSGDTLYLSNGGYVILSSYLDNTDDQTISYNQQNSQLSIEDGNTVDLSTLLDNTDNQQISISNDTLTISNGNSISLTSYLDNTDNQQISISNDTITLEDGGSVVLPSLPPQVDLDSTNEIQIISISNDTLILSNGGTVSLTNYLDNTDDQVLTISGDTLFLEDGGSVILPYDVDSLFSDELQQLQISGTGIVKNLTITDGNMIQFSVADNDNDSTNELQSLSLSNDTLSLSDGGEVFLPYRLWNDSITDINTTKTVGIGTTNPDTNASLDLGTKPFLPTRMTTEQMLDIETPTDGMMVFNTDKGCPYYFYDDTWWNGCGGGRNSGWGGSGGGSGGGGTGGENFPLTSSMDAIFSTSSGGYGEATSVVVDSKDNILVCFSANSGTFSILDTTITSPFCGVLKLSQEGDLIWLKHLSQATRIGDVEIDQDDNLYLAGYSGNNYANSNSNQQLYCSKLDSTGTLVYEFIQGGDEHDYFRSVSVDSVGNAYYAGHIQQGSSTITAFNTIISSPFNKRVGILVRINPSGSVSWVRQFTTVNSNSGGSGVTLSSSGLLNSNKLVFALTAYGYGNSYGLSYDYGYEKLITSDSSGSISSYTSYETIDIEGAWSNTRMIVDLPNFNDESVLVQNKFVTNSSLSSHTLSNVLEVESDSGGVSLFTRILTSAEGSTSANFYSNEFGYFLAGEYIGDDMTVNSATIAWSGGLTRDGFIIRFNPDGSFVGLKGMTMGSGVGSIEIADLVTNSKGDLIVVGSYYAPAGGILMGTKITLDGRTYDLEQTTGRGMFIWRIPN